MFCLNIVKYNLLKGSLHVKDSKRLCWLDEQVRVGDQIAEGVHEPLCSVEIHASLVVAECERDLGLRAQLRVEFEL